MEGRVLRRSVTLADQLAAVGPPAAAPPGQPGSCNLRDLLKLRDEDDGRRAAAVTLASAMQADRRASPSPPSSSAAVAAAAARTLLDIIRDDQPAPPASHAAVAAGDPFVRRAVSLPAPQTTPAPGPALTRPVAAPVTPPEASPPQPPTDREEEEEEQGERVSLMALLEQTERQWSAGATVQQEQEQDPASEPSSQEALVPEDDAELPEPGRGAGCCCVCMARAKGVAFIPCGHTFCRACARELLAGRGRCPLCNAAILDVLDIF
ncbi:predicted GPI-anchored protein 58 [Triticum dicoccoides]|uniref:predicted GPI-anchored protein 58 n=1 Tax=Triticum dicoccoides TaxID=85692 RepID=UPI000E79D5BF|nr:predicted GPI-anchored protein 58 [Triticum dicoccoides]